MGLFTPTWQSKNPEKRINSVKKITEIEKLQKIAEEANYEDVKQEAWKRIYDESIGNGELQQKAIKKINDEVFLASLVIDGCTCSDEALAKINNQNMLFTIVMQSDFRFAIKAYDRIINILDGNSLATIAKNALYYGVRKIAIDKLTDEKILLEIANNDKHYEVKASAEEKYEKIKKPYIARITDQNVLIDIVKNDNEVWGVRKLAIDKISDQSLLNNFANDGDSSVRRAIVEKIKDQTGLAYFAKNDENYDVRKDAVEKLTDQKTLFYIAKQDERWSVRLCAARKIIDKSMLEDIAKNDTDRFVREEIWSILTGAPVGSTPFGDDHLK